MTTVRLMTPRRRALLTGAGLATVVAVGAAACGGSSSGGQPASVVPSSATSSSAGTATTVGTAQGGGGTYLVDADGRTLYLFEADKTSTSTCTGACAAAWPPAVVTGTPTASGQVKAAKLDTTQRSDGTMQLTYAGHPLYRFSGDAAPGDMNGAGSDAFGAEWYPITPAGETLESGGESDSDSSSSSPPSPDSGYSYSY